MNALKKYLISFILLSYAGGLYLRWYHLNYFYRMQDTYFSGIGVTLISITVLLIIICFIDYKILSKFYKTIAKIKNGEQISEEERTQALGASKKINIVCVITNVVGFVIGQVFASSMDIINGVIIAVPSRLAFILLEATLVGSSLSLYEIFLFSHFISDDRKLLNIHTVDKMGKNFSLSIKAKLVLASMVGLLLMGVHCFCASYQLILQDGGKPVTNMMSEYLASALPIFILTFIPAIGLIAILASDLQHRLRDTTERIQDIGNKGDLSSRINIASKDEIGELTGGLNMLMKQLSVLVKNLQQETSIVEASAEQLSNSADVSSGALSVMKNSVSKVSAEGERQGGLVETASNGINHVTSSALEVEQQVSMQATAVQQTSASVNEMAANIQSVAEMTQKADTLSAELRETSTKGSSAITAAVTSIQEIRTASQAVQEIIGVIKRLASQTNLLSMNAAIEAAHAGTYGQGFAVVANEVRSLASSSSASAKDIQSHIKLMAQKIDFGVSSIQAAGDAFAEISRGIENTSNLVQTISQAMEEQRIGASETMKSTESVVEAIHQIQELSRQQREYAENAAESINQVVTSFSDISLSLKENTANSDNLETAINKVADCVKSNSNAVLRMKEQIHVFKV